MQYFEYNSWDDEEKASLLRYEGMLLVGKSTYFDVEEFELIIDYYLLEKGDLKKAMQAIEFADLQHPSVTEIELRKVEILAYEGNMSAATLILDRLEKTDNSMMIQLFKARTTTLQGKIKEGARLFDKLLPDAYDEFEKMHILTMAADSLMRQYEYQKALRYLHKAYEELPMQPHILPSIAYCYMQSGDWDNALLFYNKSIDDDTHNPYLWNSLGEVYFSMQRYVDAIEAFDYAMLLDASMDAPYYNKVDALVELERLDEAVAVLRDYIALQPEDPEAYCRLGECYEQESRFAEAKQCYEQAAGIDSKYAGAYYGLASIADERGDVEKAYAYLQRSVELEPENPEFWFALSQAQATRKEIPEAVSSLERTVQLDKYDYEAWMKLAEYTFMLYDVPETIAVLEQAFTVNFDVAEVAYRLAALYYYYGDMNTCLLYLERGLKIDIELVSEFFDACPEAHGETEIMSLYKRYKPSKKSKK
jgi:tetratricopeptide (TPR) repeat protein